LFDLNDFDETLPGPFEYDVKRMAASFTVAARNNGFSEAHSHAVTEASVAAYREAMAGFAQMGTMDVWYAHLAEDDIAAAVRSTSRFKGHKKEIKRGEKNIDKARTRDSLQALSKLGERVDGTYRIVSQPPIVVPMRDVATLYDLSAADVEPAIREQFRAYRAPPSRTTGGTCWSGSGSSTSPGRSSASAAWGPGPSSCCSWAATTMTPSSCR
jgi:hypothetical protein